MLPVYVEIETHSACNRRCGWCTFGQHPETRPDNQTYLKTDIILKVFRNLADHGFCGVIGLFSINEPLMDPRITSGYLVGEAQKIFAYNDVLCSITTNGDLLTDDIAEKMFDSGLGRMKISCYSDSSFHRFSQKYKSDSRVIVLDQTRYDNGKYESNRAGAVKGSCKQNEGYTSCSYPSYMTVVGWDGEVRICYNDVLNHIRLGNVTEQPLTDILNSEKAKETRKLIGNARRDVFPCRYCNVKGRLE